MQPVSDTDTIRFKAYTNAITGAGLEGKDVTQAQVGKLCAETGAFVIAETLGELEFEVEENEVTLDLNKDVTPEGEWGTSILILFTQHLTDIR